MNASQLGTAVAEGICRNHFHQKYLKQSLVQSLFYVAKQRTWPLLVQFNLIVGARHWLLNSLVSILVTHQSCELNQNWEGGIGKDNAVSLRPKDLFLLLSPLSDLKMPSHSWQPSPRCKDCFCFCQNGQRQQLQKQSWPTRSIRMPQMCKDAVSSLHLQQSWPTRSSSGLMANVHPHAPDVSASSASMPHRLKMFYCSMFQH